MNPYSPQYGGMQFNMNPGLNQNANLQPDSFRNVYGVLG